MGKASSKSPLTQVGPSVPAWIKPLAVPLVVSAALHAGVVVAFVTLDMPGAGGRIAAHNTDEVSTSIELAPRPAPPEEIVKPPEPEPVPEIKVELPPENEPAKAIEVDREPEAFDQPVSTPAPVPVEQPVVPVPVSPAVKPALIAPPVSVTKPQAISAGFANVNVREARRIVYAVDVSGAMAACLDTVLVELRRSIGRLSEGQQFQIVFFRQELNGSQRAVAIDDNAGRAVMLSATESNKRRVDQLLRSARPLGRSAPLAGLKRSLDLAPDVVFLLTSNISRTDHGSGTDAAVMRSLDDLNPKSRISGRRSVVIKTLQFVEDDPTGLMQSIAEQHGDGPGSYVLLKVADIERSVR